MESLLRRPVPGSQNSSFKQSEQRYLQALFCICEFTTLINVILNYKLPCQTIPLP